MHENIWNKIVIKYEQNVCLGSISLIMYTKIFNTIVIRIPVFIDSIFCHNADRNIFESEVSFQLPQKKDIINMYI